MDEKAHPGPALQQESLVHKLFESSPVGVALCHIDGTLVDVNLAFAKLLGRTVEETLHGKFWAQNANATTDEAQLEILQNTGRYGPYETEYHHDAGHQVRVRLSGVLVVVDDSRFIWSTVEEIGHREQAEAATAVHERFLATMATVDAAIRKSTSIDILLGDLLDILLDVFDCDRSWLVYPCDPDAPFATVLAERTTPDWPGALASGGGEIPTSPETATFLRQLFESDFPIAYGKNAMLVTATSRKFGVKAQLCLAVHPSVGRPWVLGIHNCRGPREWTEAEVQCFHEIGRRTADALGSNLAFRNLQESEERFRTLVEHAPEAIVLLTSEGRFVEANQNAVELFQIPKERLLELGPSGVSPETQPNGTPSIEAATKFVSAAFEGTPQVFEWTHQDVKGRPIACEIRLVRLMSREQPLVRGSIVDISERKQLEAQLRQSQKLEAVGLLAGGVAHDFNNLLVAIMSYSSLLKMEITDPELREFVDEISNAGSRAADLVRQLLAFSHKRVLQPQILNLNTVVEELSKMMRRVIGEQVELETLLASTPVYARADQGSLEQVLMNLATNARDAMPTGGRLTIATRSRALDAEEAKKMGTELEPGSYVEIEVSDAGEGMSAEVQERIFEPFFSTKTVGKGTGLGLSTVHGIVRQSGGDIMVKSALGAGSTFTVLFPALDRPDAQADDPSDTETAPVNGETILVVEDEAAVAKVLASTLKGAGYSVHTAKDGVEALEVAETLGVDKIDLLLTDIVMPRMGGTALAKTLRKRRTRPLPVLFCSGYAETNPLGIGFAALLPKPFTPKSLNAKVSEMFAAAADLNAIEGGP